MAYLLDYQNIYVVWFISELSVVTSMWDYLLHRLCRGV